MKVLKQGRNQKGWSRRLTCTGHGNGGGGCGAKLLVEQADVFVTERSIMGRDQESYYTFRCTNCGVLTDLPKDTNLPFDPPKHKDWVAQQVPERTERPNGE